MYSENTPVYSSPLVPLQVVFDTLVYILREHTRVLIPTRTTLSRFRYTDVLRKYTRVLIPTRTTVLHYVVFDTLMY